MGNFDIVSVGDIRITFKESTPEEVEINIIYLVFLLSYTGLRKI